MTGIIKIGISLGPVFLFLLALLALDSYKLVTARTIAGSIAVGSAAAILCMFLNSALLGWSGFDRSSYSAYLAPLVEEGAKAFFLIILFRMKRIGFAVDAAIHGFSIGAGFALVENLYYLLNIEGSSLLLWVIRGFGTAAMHQTTLAVFGIITITLADHYSSDRFLVFIPGFILAIITHSLFNQFLFSPVITTLILLVALPILLLAVFDRSEKATRDWLDLGFDRDQEILDLLTTGKLSDSKIGRYLEAMRERFPGDVVADMYCMLQVQTELALRAKGVLMLREAGLEVEHDEETDAMFVEMEYLEGRIGKMGRLALAPFLHTHSRELWQLRQIR